MEARFHSAIVSYIVPNVATCCRYISIRHGWGLGSGLHAEICHTMPFFLCGEYYTQMWKLGPKNLGANCDELASIQTLGVVIPPNTNSHFMLHKPKVLAYDDELFDSAFDSLFLYFRIL